MAELAPSSPRAWTRENVMKKRVSRRDSVSFAELILAHYLRQIEVFRNRRLDGDWEAPYRKKLSGFVHEHGHLLAAYWCTREPSGVAVTQKTFRARHKFWRRDSVMRLHAETDWITRDAPAIADEVHECQTLSIRVGEILRGTSERIAMQWLLAAISRLLGYVDQADERPLDPELTKKIVKRNQEELAAIRRYYASAGENQGRIVYFQGMMIGAMILALLAGGVTGVLYLAGFDHWDAMATQAILITITMGAIGAIVSVMSRMAGRGAFSVDYEVGRKTVRRLGSFRPFIGATFGLALYFGLESDLFQIEMSGKTIYFYAIVAFLSGFSERWAKVLLDRGGEPEPAPAPQAPSTSSTQRT
jgi:hypothetical protein